MHPRELELMTEQSANVSESIDLTDDLNSVKTKYKQIRRENQQLRTLLKQNEVIIAKNIDQLKEEKKLNLRLCQALMPSVKKFQKERDFQLPKTTEDLIDLIEKLQKHNQSDEFFKKLFQQDPAENENRFLQDTVINLQSRVQELEGKCESQQTVNLTLMAELSSRS